VAERPDGHLAARTAAPITSPMAGAMGCCPASRSWGGHKKQGLVAQSHELWEPEQGWDLHHRGLTGLSVALV